jgi:hypothetical protein
MVILYLRCLEVDVQGRIQSAEKSELFLQPFLMFLAFCLDLDHFLARFVAILQVNSNWVLNACCGGRPEAHRLGGSGYYLILLCCASFVTIISLSKESEVFGEFYDFVGLSWLSSSSVSMCEN